MFSIKTVYKIGRGPSSSHTMGPTNAAKYFKKHSIGADRFQVTLYGSLALTGKGHLTDWAIESTLKPALVAIKWNATDTSIEHPNTMDFVAFKNNKEINHARIFSIGGGSIHIKGENANHDEKHLYKQQYASDILAYCKKNKISLIKYIHRFEHEKCWTHLEKVWNVMQDCIKEGLSRTDVLPGKLRLRRRAKKVYDSFQKKYARMHPGKNSILLMSYAFAVSETNASGGIVCTAPTCGACGILPSVLKFAKDQFKLSNKKIIDALAIAGLIGNITRTNGSISGADAGCQAEVGVACAMAAAAYAFLLKLSNEAIFNSASAALEHHLGLTCDPVLGYVQSPCIERNAFASIRAVDAARLEQVVPKKQIFGYDDIVEAMVENGHKLNPEFRETSTGGLAKIYDTKHISKINHKVY